MKQQLAHRITLAGWLALLALMVYWHLASPRVLAFTAALLLLPLYGLLRGRPGAHLGTAFLMMPYFMHGTVEAYANPAQRLPALLEVFLSLTVFLAATLYSRWARNAAK